MLTIHSRNKKSKTISKDLISVLLSLNELLLESNEIIIEEILLYIDGTNAGLFCSGFNTEKQDTIDSTMIHFELSELMESLENDGYGAMDFDVIVEKSVKKAFKCEIGRKLKAKYKVILENEDGDKIILK